MALWLKILLTSRRLLTGQSLSDQNDPAWSPLYSLQAAAALTSGEASKAGCIDVSTITTVPNRTIAITSEDINVERDPKNSTLATRDRAVVFQAYKEAKT